MSDSTAAGKLPQASTSPSNGLTRRLALGLLLGFSVLIVLALVGDLRQVIQQVLNFRMFVAGFPLAVTPAIFTLSFSIVIGAASALPGGLGASEASIAGMLALLLGLSADVSAAATLLIRFATLWFGVALGLAVWATSRRMLGLAGETHKIAKD